MPDAAVTTRATYRWNNLFVVGIIAVGSALRFYHIGAQSFWLDEALSVGYARLSWPQFVHLIVSRELNMLPYYLLLRGWIHLGTEEWVVRSLSAICSIATLPLMYRLGVRLLGARAGLLAVALLALHPFHIRFAQEARGYSLMLLLVTASTLLLVGAIESPAKHTTAVRAAYVATSVLASYTHFYASLAILAQWASIAVIRPTTVSWRTLAPSGAAICILLVPLAAFVLLGHADPASWIPHPTFRRVEYLIYSLLAGDTSPGARVIVYPVLVTTLVAAGAVARAAWRTPNAVSFAFHFTLIVIGAILPIAITLTVSLFKPIFVDKYLLECLPFAVLLLATGLSRFHLRAWSLGVLLLVLGSTVHADVAYYRQMDKDDWRAATRYVIMSARSGDDALVYPSYDFAPFDYYRTALRAVARPPVVLYPGALGDKDINDAVAHLGHAHGRLWAIFDQDETGFAVRDSLTHRYATLGDRQFNGIRVLLYDLR